VYHWAGAQRAGAGGGGAEAASCCCCWAGGTWWAWRPGYGAGRGPHSHQPGNAGLASQAIGSALLTSYLPALSLLSEGWRLGSCFLLGHVFLCANVYLSGLCNSVRRSPNQHSPWLPHQSGEAHAEFPIVSFAVLSPPHRCLTFLETPTRTQHIRHIHSPSLPAHSERVLQQYDRLKPIERALLLGAINRDVTSHAHNWPFAQAEGAA
jgi:hypothetical protein